MPEIHETSILEGEVDLADDVRIGPHCVITGPVRIGAGTRLLGNVYLQGPLDLGERNLVYPFTALGFAPQHLESDPDRSGAGLAIGSDNILRESVTVSRATSDDEPTRIGDHNFWMANTHAGHDCQVGSHCVFANGTLLGGSVQVGDGVIVGGNSAIHQGVRIGRGALLTGTAGINKDLAPFFMLTGGNVAGSINLMGMRRSGMPHAHIDIVKSVYKTLYRRGLSLKRAIEELEKRAGEPLIPEYLEFLRGARRGLCPPLGDSRRGTG